MLVALSDRYRLFVHFLAPPYPPCGLAAQNVLSVNGNTALRKPLREGLSSGGLATHTVGWESDETLLHEGSAPRNCLAIAFVLAVTARACRRGTLISCSNAELQLSAKPKSPLCAGRGPVESKVGEGGFRHVGWEGTSLVHDEGDRRTPA